MTLPEPVVTWLREQGVGEVRFTRPVSGGCINNGTRLQTETGDWYFLKTNPHAPAEMFAREADGLLALCTPDGPVTPRPLLWGADFILMEDLNPADSQPHYWTEFGHQLAALHAHTADRFGFAHDNFIGSTPQPNGWLSDGFAFFAERRLLFQMGLARRANRLEARD